MWHHSSHERLFRRPAKEDSRSARTGRYQERGCSRLLKVSRSSVKRYAKLAREGLSLAPKKRPGSKPKTHIPHLQTSTSAIVCSCLQRVIAVLSHFWAIRAYPERSAPSTRALYRRITAFL